MGEYISIKREIHGPGVCKWCGQAKKVTFKYNGSGPFCNRNCRDTYHMDNSKDIRIEAVRQ